MLQPPKKLLQRGASNHFYLRTKENGNSSLSFPSHLTITLIIVKKLKTSDACFWKLRTRRCLTWHCFVTNATFCCILHKST